MATDTAPTKGSGPKRSIEELYEDPLERGKAYSEHVGVDLTRAARLGALVSDKGFCLSLLDKATKAKAHFELAVKKYGPKVQRYLDKAIEDLKTVKGLVGTIQEKVSAPPAESKPEPKGKKD